MPLAPAVCSYASSGGVPKDDNPDPQFSWLSWMMGGDDGEDEDDQDDELKGENEAAAALDRAACLIGRINARRARCPAPLATGAG